MVIANPIVKTYREYDTNAFYQIKHGNYAQNHLANTQRAFVVHVP